MSTIDYSKMPLRYLMCIDVKSFFASVEAVRRGIDPLEAYIVVVSDVRRPGAIVLASSPKVKSEFNIKTGNRKFEVPNDPKLMVVDPSMSLYLEINRQINDIFRQYAADEDILVYSIDESFLDVTGTAHLFGDPGKVAVRLRDQIKQEIGLNVTIGIGDNPLLAKLALDNEAKKKKSQIAYWSYERIPETVWKIPKLTDFWGISRGWERRLNKLGIHSIYSLAHFDPHILESKFGIMGLQQYYHANGVDYSVISEPGIQKSKGFSKGQILMRDYYEKEEILTILDEMIDDVTMRLRRHRSLCCSIGFYCGYSSSVNHPGIGVSKRLKVPTSDTATLREIFRSLFVKHWQGEPVRQFNIALNDLTEDFGRQLSLWDYTGDDGRAVDLVIDEIRDRFGKTAIFKGHSLTRGSTFFERSQNIGGHKGLSEVK
ncbi:Y-family DNA polymerase [Proteiniclasticum sp. QWL-01]|uniref:Y-family DNA polymerase n=1 Tax=Proteiniclasticum sp. QWL-01 TaxID=3036945 RepID=UPI00241086DA|nr:Y-family DNA polymerase [Proteiniclasticum sp. QWL-01]WFF71462.1 Y-family DNA polymerase [Proteiniclasticum sp. QWL-01]